MLPRKVVTFSVKFDGVSPAKDRQRRHQGRDALTDLAFTAPAAGVHGCLRGLLPIYGTGVLLRFIVALSFAEARPL